MKASSSSARKYIVSELRFLLTFHECKVCLNNNIQIEIEAKVLNAFSDIQKEIHRLSV